MGGADSAEGRELESRDFVWRNFELQSVAQFPGRSVRTRAIAGSPGDGSL